MTKVFYKLLLLIFIISKINGDEVNEVIVNDDSYIQNKTINNFLVLKTGFGYSKLMNNITYSRHDKYNKYLDNIPIVNYMYELINSQSNLHFNKFADNIKKYGFNYFFYEYNINLDIFYNKHLYKNIFFIIGLSAKLYNRLISDKYLQNLKLYLNEFNNTRLDDAKNDLKDTEEENKKEYLYEFITELENENESFSNVKEKSKNYEVLDVLLSKFGGVFGLSFLVDKFNYKSSLFINLLIYIRYRKLLNFRLQEKNKNCKDQNINLYIENNFLRINPFDISLGIEIGKGKISCLIEYEILSMLQSLSSYNSNSGYIISQKNIIKLRDFSISIRFNKY